MRATFDTNLLVSALLKPDGHSGQLLQLWRENEFELVASRSTIEELAEVLRRPHIQGKYLLTEQEIEEHVTVLRGYCLLAAGDSVSGIIAEDPNDDHVLAAATETRSDYIVSRDRHLLGLGEFQGIRILRPREALEMFTSEP